MLYRTRRYSYEKNNLICSVLLCLAAIAAAGAFDYLGFGVAATPKFDLAGRMLDDRYVGSGGMEREDRIHLRKAHLHGFGASFRFGDAYELPEGRRGFSMHEITARYAAMGIGEFGLGGFSAGYDLSVGRIAGSRLPWLIGFSAGMDFSFLSAEVDGTECSVVEADLLRVGMLLGIRLGITEKSGVLLAARPSLSVIPYGHVTLAGGGSSYDYELPVWRNSLRRISVPVSASYVVGL